MKTLHTLWDICKRILLYARPQVQPHYLVPDAIEYAIDIENIHVSYSGYTRIFSMYPNIKVYTDVLLTLIDCFENDKLPRKDTIDVVSVKIKIIDFFIKDDFILDTRKSLDMFITTLVKLEALYLYYHNGDEINLGNNREVILRWSSGILNNAIDISDKFTQGV